MQASCLLCFWTGISGVAIAVAVVLYVGRMFFVTGFFHRYFSHRSFKTSRMGQFIFALLCCTLGQNGVLWWSAHHRRHHRYSDQPEDVHSPHQHSWFDSYLGWILREKTSRYQPEYVQDFTRYPELVWLEDVYLLPGMAGIIVIFLMGQHFKVIAPELHTNGWQLLWSIGISSTAIYHATYSINLWAHLWGSRRFETDDRSYNNALLAFFTLGEGWHNNHHWCPSAARQGLAWWELDLTFYGLKVLEAFGIIWDLRDYRRDWRSHTIDSQESLVSH